MSQLNVDLNDYESRTLALRILNMIEETILSPSAPVVETNAVHPLPTQPVVETPAVVITGPTPEQVAAKALEVQQANAALATKQAAEALAAQTTQTVITQTVPAAGCPIIDQASLVKYVMESFQALGAVKGAGIQTVLGEFGYTHMNQVTAENYAGFHAKVEALKVA
jgi:hypothetical protein